uniref:thioredoxin-dependent peroxiredoxin n=1 Tax=Oncorhynchus tshawytscha TaxID=74940 RepID=A0A8C8I9N7_ONCTS
MFNTSFNSTKLLSEACSAFAYSTVFIVCVIVILSLPLLCRINTEKKQGGLGPMKIPLLADPTQAISRDYGVLKEDEGIAYRGLFVIGDKDILRQIPTNDLPVACSVDETLCLVQAFQHTDKFGEVCPAGRRPGRDTIVPDIQKSKEFFSKQN